MTTYLMPAISDVGGAAQLPVRSDGSERSPASAWPPRIITIRLHGEPQSTRRRRALLALFHRHRELPVIALHLPGAGVADRKHQRVAREELLRRAVGLGKNQLAAQ